MLDAFELATERLGRPAGAGQRVEHVEYVRDPARLAASGLLASMQPVLRRALGRRRTACTPSASAPERALDTNRFAELAAAGVPLAFGSDSPVTELGPWAAVRAAAYPHDPAPRSARAAAFAAHTRAGWRAPAGADEGVLAAGAARHLRRLAGG